MTLTTGTRSPAASLRRPAVVEHVGSPQSTSDGRATLPPTPGAAASSVRGTWLWNDAARRGLGSQIRRFAAIGMVSTLAWAGLYSLLRGAGLGSVAANTLALIVTAMGNTAANRRLTFGVTGRAGLVRDLGAGLLAFGLAISLTTASATLLNRWVPGAGRLLELTVLAVASVGATVVRFALLRAWVGRASPPSLRVT